MEALLDSLPFYIILRGVVQAIWGCPQCRSTALREEGLETQFELCLFSEVKRIYLRGASISDYRKGSTGAIPFPARARA
jgi:hypothetical protein